MSEITSLLQQALAHYQAGRFDDTEEICNRVLLLRRNEVNACHMLGMVAMQRGDLEDAVSLLDRAAIQEPENAEIQHNYAQALKSHGKLREAVQAFRRAIKVCPDSAALFTNLANTQRDLGKYDEAQENYLAALRLMPKQAEIHANLGDLMRIKGDMRAAEDQCRKALDLNPNLTFALVNLGAVLREQGRIREAFDPLSKAAEQDPANLWAWQQLGEVAADLGQHSVARQALEHVLKRDEDNLNAAFRLADVLGEAGDYAAAVEILNANCKRAPENTAAQILLSRMLAALGRFEAALETVHAIIRQEPDHADALWQWGELLAEEGRVEEAEAAFRRSVGPTMTDRCAIRIANLVPVIPKSAEALRQHRARFETLLAKLSLKEMAIADPLKEIGVLPSRLAYQGMDDRPAKELLAGIYRNSCPDLVYAAPHAAVGPRLTQGKWRIGMFAGGLEADHFRHISLGLMGQLDPEMFETIAIVPAGTSAASRDEFAQTVTHVMDVPKNLFRARTMISRLELDGFYVPAINSDPMAYFLGFARLAPIQFTGPGAPVTSGLTSIDYMLVSDEWEPTGAERHYTESLARLDGNAVWYSPYKTDLPWRGREELGLETDRNLYLCPVALDQIHPEFDAVMAEILRLDQSGELVLLAPDRDRWDEMWGRRFHRAHPDVAGRIRFAISPNRDELLNMMWVSNVMLDPFPYGNQTAALEAFSVGLPVVTQAGNHARSRRVYSLYRRMGFLDCIAYDASDYVETAVTISNDSRRHAAIQQSLLERSPLLFEDPGTGRLFETFLRGKLENWGRTK